MLLNVAASSLRAICSIRSRNTTSSTLISSSHATVSASLGVRFQARTLATFRGGRSAPSDRNSSLFSKSRDDGRQSSRGRPESSNQFSRKDSPSTPSTRNRNDTKDEPETKLTDEEITDYVKKKKFVKDERPKRDPLYDRSTATKQSYLNRLLLQVEQEKTANMKPSAIRAQEKEAQKLARAQAYRQAASTPPPASPGPLKDSEALREDTDDPLLADKEIQQDEDEQDLQLVELERKRELGHVPNNLQVIKRRGRLRFYAIINPEERAKMIQSLRRARRVKMDPRKSLVSEEETQRIYSKMWATKIGSFPQVPTKKDKLPEFVFLFDEIRRRAQKRMKQSQKEEKDESEGFINIDVDSVPDQLFRSKMLLLQAFETAVVGKSVQPMNLNLHMQGKMAVELVLSNYYATEWKRLPQKAIRSLLDVDTSVPITSSIALALGLAPYLQMTPSVAIERFKEPEKIRQRMLSSAFFSLMGLIYREHGHDAVSYFIHQQLGERYLLAEIDLKAHYSIIPGQALSVLRSVCTSYRIPSPVFATISSEAGEAVEGVWAGDRFLGKGLGRTRQQAQQNAAMSAIYHFFGLRKNPAPTSSPSTTEDAQTESKAATPQKDEFEQDMIENDLDEGDDENETEDVEKSHKKSKSSSSTKTATKKRKTASATKRSVSKAKDSSSTTKKKKVSKEEKSEPSE